MWLPWPAAAADLLARSEEAAETVRNTVRERVFRLVSACVVDLSAPDRWPPGSPGGVPLGVVLYAPDGSEWVFRRPPGPAPDPLHRELERFPGRRALRQRIAESARGVGTCYTLHESLTQLVRRDAGWTSRVAPGTGWRVAVLHDRILERTEEAPVSGRWIGAYSATGIARAETGGVGERPKTAGALSAIVLQDQGACLVRCTAADWTVAGVGLVHGGRFTVSGRTAGRTVWILSAEYDGREDRIQGELRLAGPEAASTRTIFLQRAGPLD